LQTNRNGSRESGSLTRIIEQSESELAEVEKDIANLKIFLSSPEVQALNADEERIATADRLTFHSFWVPHTLASHVSGPSYVDATCEAPPLQSHYAQKLKPSKLLT